MLTGKALEYGGSLARTQATGYGLVYFVNEHLEQNKQSFDGKTVLISGSGNVAIYAAEKAQELGAKVLTMSDSNGWIYDDDGIDIEAVKHIKEINRGRISEYVKARPNAQYHNSGRPWTVPANIVLPCATQNEILEDDAKTFVANGVEIVAEGANMPTTLEATNILQDAGVVFMPGKAANAGGVAVSGLEMSQNSERLHWSFSEVDKKLQDIMANIYSSCLSSAQKYGQANNFVAGANIAGFEKVANAMIAQGLV